MRSFRTAAVAVASAAALTLTATPAMAQSSEDANNQAQTTVSSENKDANAGSSADNTKLNLEEMGTIELNENAGGSSKIGDDLLATKSQENLYGSSLGNEGESTPFDKLTLAYVVTSAIAGIAAAAYIGYPTIQAAAASVGIMLPNQPRFSL